MPLSEEELRLLEQMERALVEEDPKLASTLRGTTMRRHARRQLIASIVGFAVGVTVLMSGAIFNVIPVGVIGFVLMLGSAYFGLMAWRGQPAASSFEASLPEGDVGGLTVLQGGKKSRRPKGKAPKSQGGSLMDRFEERWRKRREGDQGF